MGIMQNRATWNSPEGYANTLNSLDSEKLHEMYFGEWAMKNPAHAGQFPLYYFSLGHLNMCRKMANSPEHIEMNDGYVMGGYEGLLRKTTAFKVPPNITNALMNTTLPKDLDRYGEIRLPKDNMFIETVIKLQYRNHESNVFGFHILDAPLGNIRRIRNDNLFKRIRETCTFDGKKFDTVDELFDFIMACGNLRAFKTLHLETVPGTNYPETVQNVHIMWKPEHKVVERLTGPERTIRDYVFNYTLFINNPEVEYRLKEASIKANKKREQRGKLAKPNYAVIKLKGKVKQMIDANSRMTPGEKRNAHEVRGHWRTFHSDKYVNLKGERRWIPQHWRGEGYGVARNYEHATKIRRRSKVI